jgi:nucleoside-diphosphate-sugar epimerase
MKVLVLGATGATGRLVVQTLLEQQHEVVAMVRNTDTLAPLNTQYAAQFTQVRGTALTLNDAVLSEWVERVDGVVSCLGHNLTLKGIFAAPRMLVRDSIKRIVNLSENKRTAPLKIVLMNSSGVRNKNNHEPISLMQHLVLALLRVLLPPHRDNEQAANYLRTLNTTSHKIEWVSVRPDALIDQDDANEYSLYPSPIRSAIFDSGKVSRINVASAMCRLLTDAKLWQEWKGKMPLLYNADECG